METKDVIQYLELLFAEEGHAKGKDPNRCAALYLAIQALKKYQKIEKIVCDD